MRLFGVLTLSFIVFNFSNASAQTDEKIYDSPDTIAYYGNVREKIDFIYKLASVISHLNCRAQYGALVSRLDAVLMIDESGVVTSAEIPNLDADSLCLVSLKKEFLRMKKWIPARVNGKSVKSKYNFGVSCFKWEE